MLDIKFIRENLDLVKAAAKKKRITVDVEKLIAVDDARRALMTTVEGARAEQNKVSERMPSADPATKEKLLTEMRALKEILVADEKKLEETDREWQRLMVQVPNVPDVSVPDGDSDADNKEVKTWPARGDGRGGEKTRFPFKAKDHIELMEQLGMADFERGTKVAGFRGYFLTGDGALLSFAVWQYAQKFFLGKGFVPMIVPSLLRRVNFLGTGYIPQSEEDLYKTQDDDYLAGTAEVGTMGYHMGDTLEVNDLPVKYLSFSPCFRREAGSHGKDVKGLIRVHEFYKWEQVILCEASHEESVRWHEWLNRNTEE
ncbi:MAG: aminoacyl--tRNA ligase-related protein, partial [Patescibacteria group bacterium]